MQTLFAVIVMAGFILYFQYFWPFKIWILNTLCECVNMCVHAPMCVCAYVCECACVCVCVKEREAWCLWQHPGFLWSPPNAGKF